MNKSPLTKATQIIVILVLAVYALFYAKSFLIPLTFGALLAMLFIPLSKRMERKGINKAVAALLSIILFLMFFAVIGGLLAWQISDLSKDMSGIEQKFSQFLSRIQSYVNDTFGLAPKKQEEIIKQQSQGSPSGSSIKPIATITSTIFTSLVNCVLVLIYVFLFMYFRDHIKKFFLKISPPEERDNVNKLTHDASRVSQQYIVGMGMMIACLWILYGIGFSIAGVKYAIFFAILCGILEIIPFIGNIVGTSLTVLMALVQGGNSSIVIGILVTYALVQFIQTYILEPLVVGQEVNINPLFTIVGIIAGETLWGVPGMILAIPMVGIIKIVCDHFEPLKPYGFLLGQEKSKSGSSFKDKMKNLVQKAKR